MTSSLRSDPLIAELVALGERARQTAEERFGPQPEWPAHPCLRCERVNAIARRNIAPAEAESYLVPVDRERSVRRWSTLCGECADLEWSAAWERRRGDAAGDHPRLLVLERERQERIVSGRWIQPARTRP